MRKSRYIKIAAIFLATMLLASVSFAGKRCPSSLVPDIPSVWTEIVPIEVYPDFEYNGLKPGCAACPGCNPEYSFFVKGGIKDNLVIYFEGGGACWDSMNCLYAPTYTQEVNVTADDLNNYTSGIFDTDNPNNPFNGWYYVFIPYCTGDIHWGAADTVYQDYLDQIPGVNSWTIHHRGFVNFQVVLKWVTDNFLWPRKIFVTGSSAGGYGAIMAFPYIKQAFPFSRVYVLGDAANGVIGEDFQKSSIYNWNIQIPTWIPGFENGYTPDITMEDVYVDIAHYYPFSKLAQFSSAWDWNQTFFYYVMLDLYNPGNWQTGWPSVWCDWHNQMYTYVHETADQAPNYRYYISAGQYHTIMGSPQFYTENSAGELYNVWVRAMVRNPFGVFGGFLQGKWKNLECEECQDPVPCQ